MRNPTFSLLVRILKFLHQNSIMYIEKNKRQLQLRVVFLCNKITKYEDIQTNIIRYG